MDIAIHVWGNKKMDYDYQNLEKVKLMAYKAWIVLRDHPKWMENITVAENSTINGNDLKYPFYSASNDIPNSKSFKQNPNEVYLRVAAIVPISLGMMWIEKEMIVKRVDKVTRKNIDHKSFV